MNETESPNRPHDKEVAAEEASVIGNMLRRHDFAAGELTAEDYETASQILDIDSLDERKFRQELRGWRRSPDSEDYCPGCWVRYVERTTGGSPDLENQLKNEPVPTAAYIDTLKARDGYIVFCNDCGKMISVGNEIGKQ